MGTTGTSGQKPSESAELDSPIKVLVFMFVGPLVFVLVVEALGIPVTLAEWAASFL